MSEQYGIDSGFRLFHRDRSFALAAAFEADALNFGGIGAKLALDLDLGQEDRLVICAGGVVRLIAGGLVGGLGGGFGIACLDHLGLESLEVFDCGGRIVWLVSRDLHQRGEGAVVFNE